MLAITGWGVISPIGIGREAFTRAFGRKQVGSRVVPAATAGTVPLKDACVVADFDTTEFLGSRGTRSMDRTTAMAVAAVGMAIEHRGLDIERERAGVVLGTSTGSIKSIIDFTRETLVQERPYLVNPALFPNTVMNCAAGQCAIWHKLKGVNATVSGGHLSGLMALKYASLTVRRGYADILLTGGVEEFCEQSAWAHYHTRSGGTPAELPLGEGCAVFVLERNDTARESCRPVVAELLGCEVGVFGANGTGTSRQAEGLARCIMRALERAGVAPEAVKVVSSSHRGIAEIDAAEERGIALAFNGSVPPERFAVSELVGDCASAAGVFQVAAVLAYFDAHDDADERVALITSMGREGNVGCALVRGVVR